MKQLSKVALQHMESLQESKRAAWQRDQTYAKMVASLRQRWPGLYEQFTTTQPHDLSYDLAAEPTRRIGRVRPTTDPVLCTTPPRHTDAFDLRELSLAHTLENLLRAGIAAGKGIPMRIRITPKNIQILVQANFVRGQNFVWCGTVLIPLVDAPHFHQDAIVLDY